MNRVDDNTACSAVIVFDGVCVLCSGWVRFLLRHDRQQRYRFASMQGNTGRALMVAHGLAPDDPLSLLLVEGAYARTDSDASSRCWSGWAASGAGPRQHGWCRMHCVIRCTG